MSVVPMDANGLFHVCKYNLLLNTAGDCVTSEIPVYRRHKARFGCLSDGL